MSLGKNTVLFKCCNKEVPIASVASMHINICAVVVNNAMN